MQAVVATVDPTRVWLNSLSQQELVNLLAVAFDSNAPEDDWKQGPIDMELFKSLPSRLAAGRDGHWWLEWQRCEVMDISSSTSHPRWQPKVVRPGSHSTPASVTSQGQLIKSVLTQASWTACKNLAGAVSRALYTLSSEN